MSSRRHGLRASVSFALLLSVLLAAAAAAATNSLRAQWWHGPQWPTNPNAKYHYHGDAYRDPNWPQHQFGTPIYFYAVKTNGAVDTDFEDSTPLNIDPNDSFHATYGFRYTDYTVDPAVHPKCRSVFGVFQPETTPPSWVNVWSPIVDPSTSPWP